MPQSVKEPGTQLILQLLDLDGDGGLSVSQLFSGFGEAAGLRYLEEGIQCFQIHITSEYCVLQCQTLLSLI